VNEIQNVCTRIEQTRRRQAFILRWVVIPYVVVYLTAYAYLILYK